MMTNTVKEFLAKEGNVAGGEALNGGKNSRKVTFVIVFIMMMIIIL